jgi:hypothetical protein
MSHPLKKQAKYLKHVFAIDESLKSPSYQWCLQMVIRYWDQTEGIIVEREEQLVELVRPHVKIGKSP